VTAIVAMRYEGTCWIGGDSAVVTPSGAITSQPGAKVFTRGPYAFGVCGAARLAQLLRFGVELEDPPQSSGDLHEFMCNRFIPAVQACFDTAGFSETVNGQKRGGWFLVGVAGEVFEVCANYEVSRHPGPYVAIGSGASFALGSLYTTEAIQKPLDPVDRLELAMTAAAAHCPNVRPPFEIVNVTAATRAAAA
jgi:hypothetical protein